MKMIDRFMDLVSLASSDKKNPSLITKWKIQHRKYEILSELKKKTKFSAQDIYNYTWVANYTGRYISTVSFPDGFSIYLVSRFLRIEFDQKGVFPKFIIVIDGNGNRPNAIEVTYIEDNISYHLTYEEIKKIEHINNPLFDIMKEFFVYTTSATIYRVVKGELS